MTWYRNNNFMNNKTMNVRSGVTRSEIVIKNLGRDDVLSELTCNATNNNRSLPLSSTIRLDMNCKYLYARCNKTKRTQKSRDATPRSSRYAEWTTINILSAIARVFSPLPIDSFSPFDFGSNDWPTYVSKNEPYACLVTLISIFFRPSSNIFD